MESWALNKDKPEQWEQWHVWQAIYKKNAPCRLHADLKKVLWQTYTAPRGNQDPVFTSNLGMRASDWMHKDADWKFALSIFNQLATETHYIADYLTRIKVQSHWLPRSLQEWYRVAFKVANAKELLFEFFALRPHESVKPFCDLSGNTLVTPITNVGVNYQFYSDAGKPIGDCMDGAGTMKLYDSRLWHSLHNPSDQIAVMLTASRNGMYYLPIDKEAEQVQEQLEVLDDIIPMKW